MSKSREITNDDLIAAQRGLNMIAKSPAELGRLMAEHKHRAGFAAEVIYHAANQMRDVKLAMGAQPGVPGDENVLAYLNGRLFS